MTAVEILNTLGERNDPSFRPFIDPEDYDETRFIKINGKLSRIDRGDYLTSFIMAFLYQVIPMKDSIKTVSSLGQSDDIVFSAGTPGQTRMHRIRIFRRRDVMGHDESRERAVWEQVGTYLIVRNLNDFYSWYVKEFGEVII